MKDNKLTQINTNMDNRSFVNATSVIYIFMRYTRWIQDVNASTHVLQLLSFLAYLLYLVGIWFYSAVIPCIPKHDTKLRIRVLHV